MARAPDGPQLSPAAQRVLKRAHHRALCLHASELGLEHVFCALLEDESNAACQALLAGFADPASLAQEALATANGILVVASHAALPFSTLGVRALFAARAAAAARGEARVSPTRLALSCMEYAPGEFTAHLAAWGLSAEALELGLPPAAPALESDDDESIFRRFDLDAKKLLAVAARAAQAAGEPSISPQRLALAALGTHGELSAAWGEVARRALRLNPGELVDSTPPVQRSLTAEASLREYLSRLPEGGGTLDMLLAFFQPPQSLIAQILQRHKQSHTDLGTLRASFEDPETPGLPTEQGRRG